MLKIAFAGKMCSGKTWLSNKLVNDYGGIVISFASQLKKDVIELDLIPDGIIDKSRDRSLLQDYGQFRRGELSELETDKYILINIGGQAWKFSKDLSQSDWLGICYANYWIDKTISTAEDLSKIVNVFIDDIRFINEAKASKFVNFSIIKIFCSEEVRIERLIARDKGYNPEDFKNISEMQFDKIKSDYDITSDENNLAYKELLSIIKELRMKEKSI